MKGHKEGSGHAKPDFREKTALDNFSSHNCGKPREAKMSEKTGVAGGYSSLRHSAPDGPMPAGSPKAY